MAEPDDVDSRVKPGHDGFLRRANTYRYKSEKSRGSLGRLATVLLRRPLEQKH